MKKSTNEKELLPAVVTMAVFQRLIKAVENLSNQACKRW